MPFTTEEMIAGIAVNGLYAVIVGVGGYLIAKFKQNRKLESEKYIKRNNDILNFCEAISSHHFKFSPDQRIEVFQVLKRQLEELQAAERELDVAFVAIFLALVISIYFGIAFPESSFFSFAGSVFLGANISCLYGLHWSPWAKARTERIRLLDTTLDKLMDGIYAEVDAFTKVRS